MIDLPLSRSGKGALEVAIEAARRGGQILNTHFREEKQVQHKGRGNIVTNVDIEVEESLDSFLSGEYPDFGILGEESAGSSGNSGYTWIIDPLDGTNNYQRGIPLFSVVIALAKGQEALLGVVYDPSRDELFWGQKETGAFCNGMPIQVSGKTTVQDSIIGFDLGYDDEKGKRTLNMIASLWPGVQAIRVIGSAALGMAYAACGRLDLYFHPLLYPWELACGALLITEAGGKITDWEGEPIGIRNSGAIASNQALHAEFLRLTREGAC